MSCRRRRPAVEDDCDQDFFRRVQAAPRYGARLPMYLVRVQPMRLMPTKRTRTLTSVPCWNLDQ